MPFRGWSTTPKSSFSGNRSYIVIAHGKMALIEADLIIRQKRKQSTRAKTAGLCHPRMFAAPLKPVRRAYPNNKLNDA